MMLPAERSEMVIRILWLCPDLLDLYGDRGNLLLIQNRLHQMGLSTELILLDASSLDSFVDADFSNIDFIYAGPGKTRNLKLAAHRLESFRDSLRACLDRDVPFLITGSALLLFGKGFFDLDGRLTPGLGFFPICEKELPDRILCDLKLQRPHAPTSILYGFLNTGFTLSACTLPALFEVLPLSGRRKTHAPKLPKLEGIRWNQFFGTRLLGPILVKNPPLAQELLQAIAGSHFVDYDDDLESQALAQTLRSLAPGKSSKRGQAPSNLIK